MVVIYLVGGLEYLECFFCGYVDEGVGKVGFIIGLVDIEEEVMIWGFWLVKVGYVLDLIWDWWLKKGFKLGVLDCKDDWYLLIGCVCFVVWENKINFYYIGSMGDGFKNI